MLRMLFVFMFVFALCTGCGSTKTYTFNKDGQLESIKLSKDPIAVVEDSLKNKAVVLWGDGLNMSGSISPGTTDNPLPHVEGEFKYGNGGVATFPKDMPADAIEAVAVFVAATKTKAQMGVTSDGLTITTAAKPAAVATTDKPNSPDAPAAESNETTQAVNDIKEAVALKNAADDAVKNNSNQGSTKTE